MEAQAVAVKPRKGFIYVASFAGYFKIGRTKDPAKRLRSIVAVKFPEALQVRLQIPVDDCSTAEKALHFKYANRRSKGEWFSISESDLPEIERFLTTQEYLTFFPPPPRKVKTKQKRHRVIPVGNDDADADEYSTYDLDPWKMRRIDLRPKPSLHDVPRILKTENAVDFARFPYSLTTAGIALRSIGKRFGYNLCVIWDGPYNACVWKLKKPVNGNGHK